VPRGTPDTGLPILSFAYGTFTLYGPGFPSCHSARDDRSLCRSTTPYQRTENRFFIRPLFSGMVWALPLSLATTYGISFDFFSCGYLDVSVHHVSPCYAMYSHNSTRTFTPGGFPHSDIHGSMAICASPWLFAAYHVLHRLLVPRHSPYALFSLTFLFQKASLPEILLKVSFTIFF
jgi:hypothetical protein